MDAFPLLPLPGCGLLVCFFFMEGTLQRPQRPFSSSLHVVCCPSACLKKAYFDFTPMQNHEDFSCLLSWRTRSCPSPGSLSLCPLLVYISISIYLIYHQTQMSTMSSSRAASRSIQPSTAGLEQFGRMKHYRFLLLKQV